MTEKPTIIYIGSYGRSGSTLLDRLLGEIPGVISLGEVRHIWKRAFRENQWVSGGVPFRECPFWQQVIEEAFGGCDALDLDRIDALRQTLDRLRSIPRLRRRDQQPEAFIAQLDEFGLLLERLYRSVQTISRCPILVDSSKHPCYAHLLHATGRFQLKLIHLVRDPRASAFSWQRKRARPEIHWQKEEMPRFNPAVSALHWSAANYLLRQLSRDLADHAVRLRYEDLVAAPAPSLASIWQQLHLPPPDLGFIDGDQATLSTGYTIAGNPFRFKTGTLSIRPDDEWKTAMAPAHRKIVEIITALPRRKFGYR